MKHDIIEVRIKAPKVPANSIERPRLHSLLKDNDSRLFVLHATVGYGKTVLISHFIRSIECRAAWYHLYESDNDIATFMHYLSTSVGRLYPEMEVDTGILDGIETGAVSLETAIFSFISSLDAARKNDKRPLYIVLDDFQVITNGRIEYIVETMIRNTSEDVRFIVATKGRIPVFWGRYFIEGTGSVIEQGELGFNVNEIIMILAAAEKTDVMDIDDEIRKKYAAAAQRIFEDTEGWPAGVMFELLYLKHSEKTDGSSIKEKQIINDYIMRELFMTLPEKTRRFLSCTSFLEYLSPDICSYITGLSDAEDVLDYLVKENLFTYRVEGDQKIYRFHSLFREFLNTTLDSSTVREIMKKAADHCMSNGNGEMAVEYAMRAQDAGLMQAAMTRPAIALICEGRLQTVSRWVAWLGKNNAVLGLQSMIVCGLYDLVCGKEAEAHKFINRAIEMTIASENRNEIIREMRMTADALQKLQSSDESGSAADVSRAYRKILDDILALTDNEAAADGKNTDASNIDYGVEGNEAIKDKNSKSDLAGAAGSITSESGSSQSADSEQSASEAKVRVCCLGEFRVFVTADGSEIRWRTRKTAELFAYLFDLDGRSVTREKLLSVLWPEVSEKKATTLLHTSIYNIRKAFAGAGIEDLFIYDKKRYSLNISLISSDISDIKLALENDTDADVDYSRIDELLTGIRGPYMENIDNEVFVSQRAASETMVLRFCAETAERSLINSKAEMAVKAAATAVETDPFNEKNYILLIRAYIASGDIKAAKKTHDTLKKMMEKEFGEDISESTEQVIRRLFGSLHSREE